MGLARIFFAPIEIKNFLLALNEIDGELLKRFPSIREILIGHIKNETAEKENSAVIIRLIREGQDPKITAYLFIRVVLEDYLLDGYYHISDGQLSRRGECYLAIYNNVIRELCTLGWFSDAQAQDHYREIRDGVETTSPPRIPSKLSA